MSIEGRTSGSRHPMYCIIPLVVMILGSCTPQQVVIGTASAIVGTTIIGARSPGQEIEQVYYIGAFDPQEQVPPSVYRIIVRGQASVLSSMKFGSGWVRAELIDSLGTQITHDKQTGAVKVDRADENAMASLQTGRRMIMFGPEGFREAPKDHRLVIVMGASPEKFFEAVDSVLSTVSGAVHDQSTSTLKGELLKALSGLKYERDGIESLRKDLNVEKTP